MIIIIIIIVIIIIITIIMIMIMIIIVIIMLLVLLDTVLFPDTIANKLYMQKVADFMLSPGAQPSKVKKSQNATSTRRRVTGI